jgi:ankyrin repeat protein
VIQPIHKDKVDMLGPLNEKIVAETTASISSPVPATVSVIPPEPLITRPPARFTFFSGESKAQLDAKERRKQANIEEIAELKTENKVIEQTKLNFKFIKAAENGNLTLVREMLTGELKPDINALSLNGRSALMNAAKNGHTEVVAALLAHVPKPNVNAKTGEAGTTALMMAAESCHASVVKLLLAEKPDINALNRKNENALMRIFYIESSDGRTFEPAKLFETLGALLLEKADFGGASTDGFDLFGSLEYVGMKYETETESALQDVSTLLKKVADGLSENELLNELLLLAAKNGSIDAIKEYIQKGADLNATVKIEDYEEGTGEKIIIEKTPLMLAKENRSADDPVIKLLEEQELLSTPTKFSL